MDSMAVIGHLDCNAAIICGVYVCNIWAMDIHEVELNEWHSYRDVLY